MNGFLHQGLRAIVILYIGAWISISGCADKRPIRADRAELRAEIDDLFTRAEQEGFSGVVATMSDGRATIAAGYGLANRSTHRLATFDTLFQLGSVSKTFTGAAIVALQEAGKLNVGDPITRYFNDVPIDKRAITIHQLLTHTSGLPHRVGECSSRVAHLDREAYVERVLASRLHRPPGQGYEYSNDGYGLLGAIIEIASGQSYENFLRERFFEPLDMRRTGYTFSAEQVGKAARGYIGDKPHLANLNPTFRNNDGPAWCNRASGGLLSTAEDMQRWLLALQKNTVLSRTATRLMLHPHVAEAPGASVHYGYGWMLFKTRAHGLVAAHDGSLSGYYTAELRWYVDEATAFFVAANRKEFPARSPARQLAEILVGQ